MIGDVKESSNSSPGEPGKLPDNQRIHLLQPIQDLLELWSVSCP
jgi:hypothetical protein